MDRGRNRVPLLGPPTMITAFTACFPSIPLLLLLTLPSTCRLASALNLWLNNFPHHFSNHFFWLYRENAR
jgi:hypothetical protein